MRYRKLGKTDIDISVVSMGTHSIGGGQEWGESDDNESIRTLHRAVELGVNFIDCALLYGFGKSEKVLGEAMKGRRGDFVISTKGGLVWDMEEGSLHNQVDGLKIYKNNSPKVLRRQLEQSLKNLQTDYVDIYFTHWQSEEPFIVPVAESMGELMRMKEEGKIRAIGAANVLPKHVEEYVKYGQLDIIQQRFSVLYQVPGRDLWDLCQKHQITFQAYSALEMGLMTGKITMDYVVPPGFVRNRVRWYEPKRRRMLLDMLDGWADLQKKYDCSLANLTIALTCGLTPFMNVLCGPRKVYQIEDNARGGDLVLEPADLARMQEDIKKLLEKEGRLTPDPKYRY